MESPFVGQITLYGFTFAPRGWAFCDGSTLQTQQYSALYALLGNYYGGTPTAFKLPDLRGRTPIAAGSAYGSAINPGQTGGSDSFIVPTPALPNHKHAFNAVKVTPPTQLSPSNGMFAQMPTGGTPAITGRYSTASTSQAIMDNSVIASTGAGAPADNRQPSIALNYCIATTGVWPMRP